MPLTPDEHERLAYIQGDARTAKLYAELQDQARQIEWPEETIEEQAQRIADLEETESA